MPMLNRLLLWTLVCAISAGPSFFFGRKCNQAAMVVGVCLFIAAYTAVTGARAFERFHGLPFVRRTLYIGYGLRIAISLALAIGFRGAFKTFPPLGLLILADVYPGLLSLHLVQSMGFAVETFLGTLLTTIVQGGLLNVVIFVIMAIAYVVQRLFLKPPPERTRGFEVVHPSSG